MIDIVRKSTLTFFILLMVGLLVAIIPNIIAQWPSIWVNIRVLKKEVRPFKVILKSGIQYSLCQLAAFGLIIPCGWPF